MNVLSPLPPGTVSLLRSGQVITSPSCVIKELLENAIDAGANNIEIRLEDYGLNLIEVKDNGSGVKKADVMLMTAPHSTSKITSFEDLTTDRLQSYGFRGEALNSLCSLSELEIVTKSATDLAGTQATFDKSGTLIKESNIAATKGTTLRVHKLFANLPVRRNYFANSKSRKEEDLKRVKHLVASYAIIVPQLRILLFHNKKEIFRKSSVQNVDASAALVFGTDVYAQMKSICLDVDGQGGSTTVRLIVPKNDPSSVKIASRASSDGLYLFINERPVIDKTIKKILQKCFPSDRHPIAIIAIKSDPESLDVNLEPNKQSVFIRCQKELELTIENALSIHYEKNLTVGPTTIQVPDAAQNIPSTGIEQKNETLSSDSLVYCGDEQSGGELWGRTVLGTKCPNTVTDTCRSEESVASSKIRFDRDCIDESYAVGKSSNSRFGPPTSENIRNIVFERFEKTPVINDDDDDGVETKSEETVSKQNETNLRSDVRPDPDFEIPTRYKGPECLDSRVPLNEIQLQTNGGRHNSDTSYNGVTEFVNEEARSLETLETETKSKCAVKSNTYQPDILCDVEIREMATDKNNLNLLNDDFVSKPPQPKRIKFDDPAQPKIVDLWRKDDEGDEINSLDKPQTWSRGNCVLNTQGDIIAPVAMGRPVTSLMEKPYKTSEFFKRDFVTPKRDGNQSTESPLSFKKVAKSRNESLDPNQSRIDEMLKRDSRKNESISDDRSPPKKRNDERVKTENRQKVRSRAPPNRVSCQLDFEMQKLKQQNCAEGKESSSNRTLQVLGQLTPSGFWLSLDESGTIEILNHHRIMEVTFFKKLMKSQSLTSAPLLKGPIDLFGESLWNEEWTKILFELTDGSTSSCIAISDPRIVLNGIRIQVRPATGRALLTEVASCVNFMGTGDVIEILSSIAEDKNVGVEECRPLKVKNYLMGEAVRLMRQSPPQIDELSIKRLLTVREKQGIKVCLHSKEVATKVVTIQDEEFTNKDRSSL